MSQYLGDISAYALAVSQGYTGTEEEYAELMASYATVGQTAVTAAQTATTKASEAATSATTATNKATEATTAATTATTKAAEASTNASTAVSAKDTAVSASQTATTKATEATTAAETANTAKTDAVSAKNAAETAQGKAETAQGAAEDAAESVSASAAQIAQNTSDITELKSALSSVKDLEASILPMSWEQGGIDNATGETNNDGSTTRSRDVTYYKVSDLYEVTNPNNYPFYIIFYNFDGNTYTFTHSVAATGTDKDYFFNRKSEQYVRFDIRVGLGYVDTITLKAYSDIVLQIELNTNDITSLSSDLDGITEMSSNRFDPNAITDNYYITKDGVETSSNQYFVTDYIPVSNGENLYFWGRNDDGDWSNFTKRFRCAYDSSKQPVSSAGINSESSGNPWTVPSGVAYVRYSIIKANITDWTELYCGSRSVGVDYEPYGKVVKIPSIDSDETHSISNGDSLLEAVKYCYSNNIKNLIVEAGTYDIIDEYEDYYGSDYFDNYTDYSGGNLFDAGIWLQNINVKFSAGAKVICKYTGANTNVPDYFSAFATGNNVIIDGLVLDAENLRYGIHPDFNTGTEETYFIVKNSDLKHVKATGNQAIGAGLGKHVFWQFENTIFRTVGNYYAMRIHNNVDSSAQSKVIVKDCYIDGDGFFLFNAYSTSTLQTIIQVCGCSYKTAPVVGKETSASNENFTMIAWNNELRS